MDCPDYPCLLTRKRAIQNDIASLDSRKQKSEKIAKQEFGDARLSANGAGEQNITN
jgi:hypothetical protein